jgi:hypothetical protein
VVRVCFSVFFFFFFFVLLLFCHGPDKYLGATVLSTQSLLFAMNAVDVSGDGAAASVVVPTAAAAAALNWVMKDGLGQLGTLLVAGRFGSRVDAHPQLWYAAAGVMLEFSLATELASPLFPAHFVVAGAAASTCKGMSWLAGGGAQAALLLSLAGRNNMGDLAAKGGAQATAASLLGTAAGIGFSAACHGNHTAMVIACATVLPLHLLSVWRCAAAVPLQTVSPGLAVLLADAFWAGSVPAPQPGLTMRLRARGLFSISALPAVTPTTEDLRTLAAVYTGERYMLRPEAGRTGAEARGAVVLHAQATDRDVVQAALQLAWLRRAAVGAAASPEVLAESLRLARASTGAFLNAAKAAGWHMERLVATSGARVIWGDQRTFGVEPLRKRGGPEPE